MKINVKVFPASNRNEIVKIGADYKAYVKDRAENNKANVALIKLISKEFNINYKKIKIINPSSRKKIVELYL